MTPLIERECNGRILRLGHSTRADGDLSPSVVPAHELADRRASLIAHPWRIVRQIHSDRVVETTHRDSGGQIGDALIMAEPDLVLAVHSGDCVPVGFVSDGGDGGVVAAAHAGWKGLEAGVLETTVRRLRQLAPSSSIIAAVGPHIRAGHYEFGPQDLDRLSLRFGGTVAGVTNTGQPALDLTAAIAAELERLDTDVALWSSDCTAADGDKYWSHRARQEPGRIALTAWIQESDND